MNVNAAADYLILSADLDAGDVMTHLKLQKLLYYAQGWNLAQFGVPLFEDDIEAWTHGPVVRSVWSRFRDKSWSPILPEETVSNELPESHEVLDQVWERYGCYSAKFLEDQTHSEEPWVKTWNDGRGRNCVIPHELMARYFKDQLGHGAA